MAEITYLPEIECSIQPGFLPGEWAVSVPDEKGKRQNLRVNKSLVAQVGQKHYLGIGIVELDYKHKRALIELPHEADSGVNRLWVPFASFRQSGRPWGSARDSSHGK
jgi:hypothetical protein